MYEKKYETLGEYEEDRDYSYCQMINVGRKVTLHNIHGFLANQTVQYLQHFHLRPRQIWLTRSAESYDDVDDRVGGESSLTDAGIEYAKVLHIFINEQRSHQSKSSVDQPMAKGITRCQVLTSNIPHSIETASFFNESSYLVMHVKFLDELNPGSLTGLTREQIKEQHVQWYRDRESNKIRHRYPGITGESYLDVRERLKSIILEVERMHEDVVLLSGLAVMRVLIAYFKGLEQEEMPELDVPLGTVYMFEPVSLSFTAFVMRTNLYDLQKPYGIVHQEYRWDASSKVFLEVKRMDNS
jgi:6-phosphofructo-2-kinase